MRKLTGKDYILKVNKLDKILYFYNKSVILFYYYYIYIII